MESTRLNQSHWLLVARCRKRFPGKRGALGLVRDVEWPKLQEPIWKLLIELPLAILEELYTATFNTGKIYPYQVPLENGKSMVCNRLYDRPSPRLLTLNPRIYSKYGEYLWFNNTWVIEPGDMASTTGFIRKTRYSVFVMIKSAELHFTTEDLRADAKLQRFVDPYADGLMPPCRAINEDTLHIVQDFRIYVEIVSALLQNIW